MRPGSESRCGSASGSPSTIDQVGELALRHGADVLVQVQRLGRGLGRGHEGLGGGEPVVHHPLDLQAGGQAHVAAERDLDPGLPGGPHAGRALLEVVLRQFGQHRRHPGIGVRRRRVEGLPRADRRVDGLPRPAIQ